MSENESLKKIKAKKKNKKRKKKIILFSTLGVLAILIAVGVWYYNHIKNRIFIESKPNNNATQEVDYEE